MWYYLLFYQWARWWNKEYILLNSEITLSWEGLQAFWRPRTQFTRHSDKQRNCVKAAALLQMCITHCRNTRMLICTNSRQKLSKSSTDQSSAQETWSKFLFSPGDSPLETSVESSLGLCWPWSAPEAACNQSKASANQTRFTHGLGNSCNSWQDSC